MHPMCIHQTESISRESGRQLLTLLERTDEPQVAPSVVEYAELGTGASAFGMGVCTVLLCVLSVYAIVEGCGIGRPRKRDTPLQEWEKGRWVREAAEMKREDGKRERGGGAGGQTDKTPATKTDGNIDHQWFGCSWTRTTSCERQILPYSGELL